jgi:preprotein translocase subunit SecD
VEIPGVSDVDSAVSLIGQTAQLVFMQLPKDTPWNQDQFAQYYQDKTVWEPTGITGADLKGADVVFSQSDPTNAGRPQIQLKFTNEGRKKFSEVAKANVNKPIALYLDTEKYPLSMPVVSADLAAGLTNDPVINGSFDVATANALSLQIRAGALPVPVTVLEQKTVGATLGADSVKRSFIAGAIGLILVLLFMVFMYGRLGVISGIALVIYSFLVLAIFKFIPVVLTLPGIAGFILSIGMATDANILIFERVKEEMRWGRPKNLAIKLGFERAWDSIKDSNASSLITCAILFYFGTGPVKGFALTLAIGIFASLFSAIFVVKTLIQVFNIDESIIAHKKLTFTFKKLAFNFWRKNANH